MTPQAAASISEFATPTIAAGGVGFRVEDQDTASDNPSCPNHIERGQMRNSRGPYARKIRGNSRNVLLSNRDTADLCQQTLLATYDGDASRARAAAADSGMSAKAAENWLAGDNPMSLTAFLNAYRANPTFKAWARKILLMEKEIDPEFQAQLAAFIVAAQRAGS